MTTDFISRRAILAASLPLSASPALLAAQNPSGSQQIQLPPFVANTERQGGPPPAPLPPEERVGFALVGLGRLTVEQLLPAFQRCEKARPVALVSGTPDKARQIAHQYGIPDRSIYDYKSFDRIREDPQIQAVYIVLPNGMHHEYVLRAAAAKKHVLCEKPMANSSKEAAEMVAACAKAERKLMIAYRIQYETHSRLAREMIKKQQFGPVKLIESANVQRQGEANQWRHNKKLAGGGSLPDIGLYCINATRFLLGDEPTEVFAMIHSTAGDPRFREVEENVVWHMRFPNGVLTSHVTGYDAHESRRYRVHAPLGWIDVDPAFSYSGLRMRTGQADGRIEKITEHKLEEKNQFVSEIDHFADCVKNNREPYTPGAEGLQDQKIMEAIYESARLGRPVSMPAQTRKDSFRGAEPEGLT